MLNKVKFTSGGKNFILCVLASILLACLPAGQGSTLLGEEPNTLQKALEPSPPIKAIFVPKDPLIAGLLSVEFPGLGQIYCRRYLRGITFLSSEIGCFVLAGAMAGLETQIYSWDATNAETEEKRELTQKVTISKWDELSGLERAGVEGLVLGGICLHIWNVIDAYNIAQEHNQRLGWLDNIDVKLGFLKENDPLLELTLSRKF